MLFCRHYFNPFNTFMRKGKDPDPVPLTNGSGFGRPKNMRIRFRILNIAAYCLNTLTGFSSRH
jgi:hypothetical protein